MTIFVNSDTRVIVQGMTGAEGRKHTQRMLSAGTAIVGGTNPRRPARPSLSTCRATAPAPTGSRTARSRSRLRDGRRGP